MARLVRFSVARSSLDMFPPQSAPSVTSTKLTHPISLSRRLLFPNLPSTADLPPLLSSPSASPQLNAELYDFIALALRAFVNPWWSKVTRYDRDLVPEVNRVISVVVRALEARILATDLSLLVFRDIPSIITQHYRDYRNASSKLSTSYASASATSLSHLFHQLQPHMAISADGQLEHEYFRQIVDHILKTCLPPEDYQPEAERFLIREIVLKVLLQDVIPKITQPWFIQKLILDEIALSESDLEVGVPFAKSLSWTYQTISLRIPTYQRHPLECPLLISHFMPCW
jgi:hypothetical protein